MLNTQFQNNQKLDKSEIEKLKIKIIQLINEKENKRKLSVTDASTMVNFKSNSEVNDKQNIIIVEKNEEIIQENTILKKEMMDNLQKLYESENEKAILIANIESQVWFILS